MPKYRVELTYLYKDVQEVEANSREVALSIAESNAEEVYDCYLDNDVTELGMTMTTLFEEAGYTEDTTFVVVRENG